MLTTKTLTKSHYRNPIISRSFRSLSQATYAGLIAQYALEKQLQRGRILHAHLIINGLARLTYFATKLISFYTELRLLPEARKLFDKIPKSNERRWVALIGAYSRRGFYQEALGAFGEMQQHGLCPNKFVIPSVLKACGHVLDLRTGRSLHCVVLKCEIVSDVFVVSSLIDMYSKCGQVEKAWWVFDTMVEKDLVALNAMVSGYVQHGLVSKGYALVEQMQARGMELNVVTWNTLISGFAQEGDDVMISKLFDLMVGHGQEPDVVTWTSVISGMVQNFRNEAALGTFKRMLERGFSPSSATISSILPACATSANVSRGREIHGYSVVVGFADDIYVRSALIDMYAKCGFISQARMLFGSMQVKNTVTWNSMIFGYANHGYCHEAVELFNQMEELEGKKLDHLTFTAVLSACCHAGMVQLGHSLFLSMQEKHKIVPRLEHYACIVDLLGRAGKLTEAYELIKTMPVEPDLFVWGALLGACRNHGNVELAEVAASHLAKLEPGNAGNNMLLSNLYADAGSWENVASYKKTSKRKKLKTFPGCSWIEAV